MKLSKTTQKLHNKVLSTITALTVDATNELEGFVNIEHSVQFDHFPSSLLLICYFESKTLLTQALAFEPLFQKKLHHLLLKQGILLKNARQNLKFSLVALKD